MGSRSPSRRSAVALAGLCSLLVAASLPHTCFGRAVPLSSPGVEADLSFNFKKSIATLPDGSVHATWYEAHEAGFVAVYARSLSAGAAFGPPRPLSGPLPAPPHPAIAASAGRVYVGWHEQDPASGHSEVVLRRSPDGGATFAPAEPLALSGAGTHVSLAASGPFVHAVWGDLRSGVPEIHVRSSHDAGASFLPEQQLSDAPYESWVPAIDAFASQVAVAWVDYRDGNEEEYLRVSLDAGQSWQPAIRVTTDPADSWAPSLAIRGPNLFFTWFDRRAAGLLDGDVEAVLDEAAAWLGLALEPAPPRSPDTYYLPLFTQRIEEKKQAILAAAPAWVMAGGDPVVIEGLLAEFEARLERWSHGWSVYFKRSPDLGQTWEPARVISPPGVFAHRPSLALAGPDLHIAWYGGAPSEPEVFYRRSPNLGDDFLPPQVPSPGEGASLRPSIAAVGPGVQLLWADDREDERRVFHQRGHAAGAADGE